LNFVVRHEAGETHQAAQENLSVALKDIFKVIFNCKMLVCTCLDEVKEMTQVATTLAQVEGTAAWNPTRTFFCFQRHKQTLMFKQALSRF